MVTTTAFEGLTRGVADTLGLPQARILVVDHPLGGTAPDVVARWADESVETTLALLRG